MNGKYKNELDAMRNVAMKMPDTASTYDANVQRFDFVSNRVFEAANGGWVRAADYDSQTQLLQQALRATQADLANARITIGNMREALKRYAGE